MSQPETSIQFLEGLGGHRTSADLKFARSCFLKRHSRKRNLKKLYIYMCVFFAAFLLYIYIHIYIEKEFSPEKKKRKRSRSACRRRRASTPQTVKSQRVYMGRCKMFTFSLWKCIDTDQWDHELLKYSPPSLRPQTPTSCWRRSPKPSPSF